MDELRAVHNQSILTISNSAFDLLKNGKSFNRAYKNRFERCIEVDRKSVWKLGIQICCYLSLLFLIKVGYEFSIKKILKKNSKKNIF